ncbi:putative short-chain dehydrogenase [Lepidopterella palustris CBS 459.81]|uniref:Putative short-chain dehydrogenase n=1 Tax=Lepidopterella palustris CBS 459.81 TaxID=1314670 RepID=A0A8E2DXD9_9PEZI|nr:putative short-chain dehydrogenase [Lepidopterella palustris CBS 459.81]
MSPKTILILGAGPRVGWSIGKKFAAEGYSVAVASRKPDSKAAEADNFLPLSVDLTKPESVKDAFKQTKEKLGVPSVVIYNAATLTFPPDFSDPFSVGADAFIADTAVNAVGAFAAIQESVAGFKSLDAATPKVFIATGNILPFNPVPLCVTLGAGKAALAHFIDVGTKAYAEKGYRFYFASQVTKDGNTVDFPELSGEAHGNVYWELVGEKEQGPWDVRFVGDGKRWVG